MVSMEAAMVFPSSPLQMDPYYIERAQKNLKERNASATYSRVNAQKNYISLAETKQGAEILSMALPSGIETNFACHNFNLLPFEEFAGQNGKAIVRSA